MEDDNTITIPAKSLQEKIGTDKSVAVIYSTRDYDKFSFRFGNRDVNDPKRKKRLVKLKKEIEKLGKILQPALINKKFEIIDGQGRYTIAQELGIPLPYFIDPNAGDEEMISANQETTVWELKDKIDFYAKQGKKAYLFINDFQEKYKLQITSTLMVMFGTHRGHVWDKIKSGELQVDEGQETLAHVKARRVAEISKYADKPSRSFIGACCKVINHSKYDHAHLLKKLDTFGELFRKGRSMTEYVKMIQDTYNFKVPKDERIQFIQEF